MIIRHPLSTALFAHHPQGKIKKFIKTCLKFRQEPHTVYNSIDFKKKTATATHTTLTLLIEKEYPQPYN